MENDNINNHRMLNKNLTKEDLSEEEKRCYDKLMDGIDVASGEEKEEIARLMNIAIEIEEETYTNCIRCGEEFMDVTEDTGKTDKKIYCDKCLKRMWSPEAL